MALRLADHWVWDIWLADDGDEYHLFFLRASRALHDPDRRHHRATIGHARSTDLTTWTLMPDALVPSDAPAFDDLATWTGSVVRGTGQWHMFYTGVSRAEQGLVQRIGMAVSDDLQTWSRPQPGPIAEADPRWYEKLDLTSWRDEAWRDPWVFADPDGDGWHMLVTARAAAGPADSRGVIGHLRSPDLFGWEAGPPIAAGSSFGHLEVPQVATVDGQPLLLFSCMPQDLAANRRVPAPPGGVWTARGTSELGPFDIDSGATAFDHPSLYSGRLIRDRDQQWVLLGFLNHEPGEAFIGAISDPIPVGYQPGKGLVHAQRGSETSKLIHAH
jgi:beta-fructofuranosidase